MDVRSVRAGAVIVAAGALAGCSSGTTQPSTVGVSSHCTVTLSGALTGSYDCRPATTVWTSADNTGGFSFLVNAAGTTPAVTVAIGWAGEPSLASYVPGGGGVQGGALVTTAASQSWRASVGGGAVPSGSFTLVFTAVADTVPIGTGNAYSTDGTLDATLAAVATTGATGTITLHAVF